MSFYNPDTALYRFPAAALASAAVVGRIYGPKGKRGRLIDVSVVLTTATTVAATSLTLGTVADADAYATLSVPVQAVNTGVSGITRGTDIEVNADTILTITSDGGSTAGAGDILVQIGWY